MDLLVVRHAIAVEQQEWADTGKSDDERPLTRSGRSKMKRCADGLLEAAPKLELIATSPLVRAAETARILHSRFEKAALEEVASLASGGSPSDVIAWIAGRSESAIALVGHEPDLGNLIGRLLSSRASIALPLRKGGACLLRLQSEVAPGKAELRWLMPPSLLARLAGR